MLLGLELTGGLGPRLGLLREGLRLGFWLELGIGFWLGLGAAAAVGPSTKSFRLMALNTEDTDQNDEAAPFSLPLSFLSFADDASSVASLLMWAGDIGLDDSHLNGIIFSYGIRFANSTTIKLYYDKVYNVIIIVIKAL